MSLLCWPGGSAGTDAFSLCEWGAGVDRRQIILISAVILVFHILCPGHLVPGNWQNPDRRAAAVLGSALLIYLGVRMILGSLKNDHGLESPLNALA